jgi:hypothetical protein
MRFGPELTNDLREVKMNTRSVARGAKDSTFQFPMLVDDSIPVDMTGTIGRTFDYIYANFAQSWISMNSTYDMTLNPSPFSYLKKLHQNVKFEGLEVEPNDVESYMEKVYDGSYRLYMNESNTFGVLFNVADKPTKLMLEANRDQLRDPHSGLNLREVVDVTAKAVKDYQDAVSRENKEYRDQTMHELNYAKGMRDLKYGDPKAAKGPKLTNQKVEKLNDMTPYGLEVRLIAVNDQNQFVQYVDIVLGIKTVIHPVQADDLIDNIGRAVQNKSLAFKFLRWTTGELSLIKDLILNMNEMRNDAFNRSSKTPFFSKLKRIKNRRFGIDMFGSPHFVIPNSTIVVSTYVVDKLNESMGIDLRNPATAKKTVDSLFLMGLVILDEGTGLVSVMYDGDTQFQNYTIDGLEKDRMLNSNKLGNEIGRMIAR